MITYVQIYLEEFISFFMNERPWTYSYELVITSFSFILKGEQYNTVGFTSRPHKAILLRNDKNTYIQTANGVRA